MQEVNRMRLLWCELTTVKNPNNILMVNFLCSQVRITFTNAVTPPMSKRCSAVHVLPALRATHKVQHPLSPLN